MKVWKLGKKKTVFKVTPLKAGTTKLRTAEAGNGPGGSKGSKWSQGQTVPLVVTAYSVDQIKLGNTRYHTPSLESDRCSSELARPCSRLFGYQLRTMSQARGRE